MRRREFLRQVGVTAAAVTLPALGGAGELAGFPWKPEENIIPAPSDPRDWPAFRSKLRQWRDEQRRALGYSDALYRRPDFAWVASNFACCFLMLCDERFYDAQAGQYRVAAWLQEARRETGGFDSIVLWQAYPRIGLDDRNQFDFYRDAPGGLPGLRRVVDELHQAGVRVYIDYNPWDIGTRRETRGDVDMLAELVAALQVDGIFLDTLREGAAEFRQKLDAVRPGVALEGEIALPMNRLVDHHMEWAQWFADSAVPGVVRNKWFERRHMMHHVARWDRDRTSQFQAAFMNGTGTMVWDNVFGSWVGYSEREKSILRTMLPIQRRFASLFAGERWTPLVPIRGEGCFASLWEGEGLRLWTVINREEREAEFELDVALSPGERCWDLARGAAVSSARAAIRPRGLGCLLAAQPGLLGADFETFLETQHAIELKSRWDSSFPGQVRTRWREPARTQAKPINALPPEMVAIPGCEARMVTHFRVRECGWQESTPDAIRDFGKLHARTSFERMVTLRPFAMDTVPVTNGQFARFLREAGYQPRFAERFLAHWVKGAVPAGFEDHPVVYVDLEDARAYARWAGKRLPTEEEWQWAAQGGDGRRYPWGNDLPTAENHYCNGTGPTTTPVRQFPAGRSALGLLDLCGNTWEWTESERNDGINRFAILRGGSYFKAKGSDWYMDGGPQEVSFGCKCLLTWPGLDRCGTVGFRCALDLA